MGVIVLRWLQASARHAESAVIQVSRVLNVIGVIAVGMLMLLITLHVLGRELFNAPITGITDICEFVMIIAVYCAVAYCAVVRGHISVDLIVSRFSERGQAITDTVTGFGSLAFFSLVAWSATSHVLVSHARGDSSLTWSIVTWPFRIVLLIGIVMLCLVLLVDFVHLVARLVKK